MMNLKTLMKIKNTELYEKIGIAGISELKSLANKYGITIGELFRLGYNAEVGPYRYHLRISADERSSLSNRVSAKGVSYSSYLMSEFERILIEYKNAPSMLQDKIDAAIFEKEGGYVNLSDTCISFNNIDFVLLLEYVMSELNVSAAILVRALFLIVMNPDRS